MYKTTINNQIKRAYKIAQNSGWHDESVADEVLLLLIHTEVSEAAEALRHGNPPDDKIPEFSGLEAELADVCIRVFDMAGAGNLRLQEAIIAKMDMNELRAHKHGGKRY